MKRSDAWRKWINVLLTVMVVIGYLMVILVGDGGMSVSGRDSLKYFTVQSNLLEGAASVMWLMINGRKKVSEKARRFGEVVKYVAGVCVGLTFVTVMVFLGPLYGYLSMLRGANIFFHLAVPLLAMAEVVGGSERMGWRENLLAMIPMLLYSTVYLVNILVNGLGEPFQRDIYGFVTWGMPIGIGIFAAICAADFLIGLVLRGCSGIWRSRHAAG